ncbi:MAG: hypothetical protein N2Z71_07115 [Caloramator sp.]|nr:hypothetical protein [Caloramator sp.]
MSMPVINPSETTPCQAVVDILESIALQEAGLAHIINAEGEKIQAALQAQNVSIGELIEVNESVLDVLTKVIKLEIVLELKLEEVIKLYCCDCHES